jgi:hypothetical protein
MDRKENEMSENNEKMSSFTVQKDNQNLGERMIDLKIGERHQRGHPSKELTAPRVIHILPGTLETARELIEQISDGK